MRFDCHDCSFQASTSTELMKHLRLTGRQPGKAIQDIRSKFIVCYTCKEEYVSYWSLMNHRRQKHPSNKICRYFQRGQCIHGINCWYRHDEPMELDSSASLHKQVGQKCDKVSASINTVKPHVVNNHQIELQSNCSPKQVFQNNLPQAFPPDHFQSIMQTLKMVLQRIDVVETRLQNQQ